MGSLLANRGLLLAAWVVVLAALGGALTFAWLQPPPPSGAPVVVALNLPPETAGPEPAPAEEAAEPPREAPTPPPAEAPEEGAVEPDASEAAEAEPAPLPEATPEAETSPETPVETPPESAPESAPDSPTVTAPLPKPKPETGEAAQAPTSDAPEPAEEQVVTIPVVPPAPEQLAYWERYRQPFNMADERPRIAVVLSGLGLSDGATEAAINQLPAAVTLSFSPYARGLERWIALARSRGHEVMLDLPMEPTTFPNEDPGPQALLTDLSAEENLNRLDWVLSRGSAYVGLAGSMGSRFTASREAMEPILQDVKSRGLIFLDRRTTEDSVVAGLAAEIGVPAAVNNRSVDERQASRVAIDARLAQIERIALTDGYAVAMAQPYPVTLDRLADWATELTARGFVIAPITALAGQQKLP